MLAALKGSQKENRRHSAVQQKWQTHLGVFFGDLRNSDCIWSLRRAPLSLFDETAQKRAAERAGLRANAVHVTDNVGVCFGEDAHVLELV